jgi:hypothetical protein
MQPQDEPNQAEGFAQDKPELTNSAKRLFTIIDPALRMADGNPALQVWGEAFGIDASKAQQDPHEVVGCLRMLRDEVVLLRKLMLATRFSIDLYEPALNAILAAISVSNLASPWGHFRPHILGEHMLALRWCSQAIDSEEGLTHAELQHLLDAISAFRQSTEDDGLPDAVRTFVLHQIDLMVRGIHEYPIRGRQAMRDAVKAAAADAFYVHDDVTVAAPVAFREKLAGFWKAGLGAAEGSEKMVKLLTGVAEAVPKLVNAIHTAANSLT